MDHFLGDSHDLNLISHRETLGIWLVKPITKPLVKLFPRRETHRANIFGDSFGVVKPHPVCPLGGAAAQSRYWGWNRDNSVGVIIKLSQFYSTYFVREVMGKSFYTGPRIRYKASK